MMHSHDHVNVTAARVDFGRKKIIVDDRKGPKYGFAL